MSIFAANKILYLPILFIQTTYGFYCFTFSLTFSLRESNPKVKITGKTVAKSNPVLRLPPAISESLPTIAGLTVAPKSPAKAKKANIAVPPPGHFCDEILSVPGHIIPTESPQTPQAIRLSNGFGNSDTPK